MTPVRHLTVMTVVVASMIVALVTAHASDRPEKATPPTTTTDSLNNGRPTPTRDAVLAPADLADGGQVVVDPFDNHRRYNVVPQRLVAQPENFGKKVGLFVSSDQGKTWRSLSAEFDFRFLFVHPIDRKLYAVIGHESQETGEDGYLHHYRGEKIVQSADGQRWKDITGRDRMLAHLGPIFQDPDHPDRICVHGTIMREGVYQAVDQAYSGWSFIRGSHWTKSHPASRPAR